MKKLILFLMLGILTSGCVSTDKLKSVYDTYKAGKWKKRMTNVKRNQIDNITFSNGYSKDRDQFKIQMKYISIRTGLKEWGAEPNKVYFVLHLGDVIEFNQKVGDCE